MAENQRVSKKPRSSVGGSSSQSQTLDYRRFFSSSRQEKRFLENFLNREIINSYYIDLDFISNYLERLEAILREQEVLDFLTMKEDTYPDLVRVFYSNLKYENNIITSHVKKRDIEIDWDLWGTLTKLPIHGDEFSGRTAAPEWEDDFSSNLARKMLLRVGANIERSFTTGLLTIDNRVLHFFVVKMLLARAGNYALVVEEDIVVLWAMLDHRPINWGLAVLHHMLKHRANSALPYAMLVTRILKHFKIPLNEELKEAVPDKNKFGLAQMRKFGLRREGTEWEHPLHGRFSNMNQADHPEVVPRYPPSPQHQQPDDAAAAANAENPNAPQGDFSQIVLQEIRGMRAHMDYRFDTLQTHVDERCDKLSEDVNALRRRLDDFSITLTSPLAPSMTPGQTPVRAPVPPYFMPPPPPLNIDPDDDRFADADDDNDE